MDSAALTVIGILVGILIFGIKSGIGCGFSNISTRVILAVGGSYFLLALLFGSVIDKINLEAFEKFYSMGMGIHIFVSLLLIMTGIYTQKKWNSGKDVSRHISRYIHTPSGLSRGSPCCILPVAFRKS